MKYKKYLKSVLTIFIVFEIVWTPTVDCYVSSSFCNEFSVWGFRTHPLQSWSWKWLRAWHRKTTQKTAITNGHHQRAAPWKSVGDVTVMAVTVLSFCRFVVLMSASLAWECAPRSYSPGQHGGRARQVQWLKSNLFDYFVYFNILLSCSTSIHPSDSSIIWVDSNTYPWTCLSSHVSSYTKRQMANQIIELISFLTILFFGPPVGRTALSDAEWWNADCVWGELWSTKNLGICPV